MQALGFWALETKCKSCRSYSIVRVVCAPHVGFATYGGFVVSGERVGEDAGRGSLERWRERVSTPQNTPAAKRHARGVGRRAARPDAHAVSMLHCALDVPADAWFAVIHAAAASRIELPSIAKVSKAPPCASQCVWHDVRKPPEPGAPDFAALSTVNDVIISAPKGR